MKTFAMTEYLVILEDRANLDAELTSFIIQARNLLDAQNQTAEYVNRENLEVYIQSITSIWLHNDIRRAKRGY